MSRRTRARACPERTCVGCREHAGKAGLLRVVMIEGRIVPDLRGTLPGRGAYVHPAQRCVDLAVRRRAFQRAFRAQGPLDTAELQHLRSP
ncbi:YlxR family protein [Streptomyces sp. DSM 42041]|uniref:YlxR family protein n=1 Tax=Streptomyces hazeniae TaxID=3075538 RepID=A0ABU2NPA6_9ACTN|nr:YlxR family protein [Streptomyces sp. DSM 42041]MDT0378809.1 YlxR family protein [Streptomyces sp. DSM 42041]